MKKRRSAHDRAVVQFPLFPLDVLDDLLDPEFMTDEQWEAILEEEEQEYITSIINGPFYVEFEELAYGQLTILACKTRRGVTLGWAPKHIRRNCLYE